MIILLMLVIMLLLSARIYDKAPRSSSGGIWCYSFLANLGILISFVVAYYLTAPFRLSLGPNTWAMYAHPWDEFLRVAATVIFGLIGAVLIPLSVKANKEIEKERRAQQRRAQRGTHAQPARRGGKSVATRVDNLYTNRYLRSMYRILFLVFVIYSLLFFFLRPFLKIFGILI